MAAAVAAQVKPTFAGEWKLAGDPGAGQSGIDLTITQNDTAMTVTYRAAGPAPAPVKLTYRLDGSASPNMVTGLGGGAPAEQVSKVTWAANTLVVTTTTRTGLERRTFSMDGADLVVDTSVPAQGGGLKMTKAIYKRYVRGYGG
ncbi:MAG: hypothetical protein ABIU38_18340 [Vicinamibacteraceae bacterium]